jgi:hypothetical protein
MKKLEMTVSLPESAVEGRKMNDGVHSLPWHRKAAHCRRRESLSAEQIPNGQNVLKPLAQPNSNGHRVLELSAQLTRDSREGHKALEQLAEPTRNSQKVPELIGDSQNGLEPLEQPNSNGHKVLELSA